LEEAEANWGGGDWGVGRRRRRRRTTTTTTTTNLQKKKNKNPIFHEQVL